MSTSDALLVRAPIILCGAMIGVCFLLVVPPLILSVDATPTGALPAAMIGIAVVGAIFAFSALMRVMFSSQLSSMRAPLLISVLTVTLIAMAPGVSRELEGAVQMLTADPTRIVALLLGAGGMTAVILVMGLMPADASSAHPAAALMSATAFAAPPPAAKDDRRSAAHETGHVLALAACGPLNPTTTATIDRPGGAAADVGGRVESTLLISDETPAELILKTRMLFCIAGLVCERALMGGASMGARDDMSRWTAMATEYLEQGFGEVYYPLAADIGQVRHNIEVLNRLREAHFEAVHALVTANLDLAREICDLLIAKRTVAYEDLRPLTDRVVLPATGHA